MRGYKRLGVVILDVVRCDLLDGAADAAVSDIQPLLNLFLALVHSKGLFDVQSFFPFSPLIMSAADEGRTYSLQILERLKWSATRIDNTHEINLPFIMTAIFFPCWAVRM